MAQGADTTGNQANAYSVQLDVTLYSKSELEHLMQRIIFLREELRELVKQQLEIFEGLCEATDSSFCSLKLD